MVESINKQISNLSMENQPEFIKHRIGIWEREKQRSESLVNPRKGEKITITLPDSRTIDGLAFETTPHSIAASISKSLADRVVVAKVSDCLWDLHRPLENDCLLQLLDFDSSEEAKMVFWHSSAHILGEACEMAFHCHLCHGPPTADGFFYDMGMNGDVVLPGSNGPKTVVAQEDFPGLESRIKKIVQEKQPFERLELSKEVLLEMFSYNPFKVHFIKEKVPDGTSTTVYRCGPLIDLCLGPHVPHTGRVKAMRVTKNSASYFQGDSTQASLQRVYGISFPSTDEMKTWLKWQEEAEKRNHRRIGTDHQLFFFHELSPGSCFFLPHGARMYRALETFIRKQYWERGFQEVVTPNIYNVDLWRTSGHWQNYRENMFSFKVEDHDFALKPMNCPGHCLMFAHKDRSYRELPLRLADFGVLHRNEFSGALTGLTRVRRFCQDDAHIFCMASQITGEIKGALEFVRYVYEDVFGFTFSLKLSTRPEKYLGEIEEWDRAESQLKEALDGFGKAWELNPGDGAFYGPKIDITIMDAYKRKHQCATIQLDFQLPQKFKLQYSTADQKTNAYDRPVMIHRAVLGSLERMMAILIENFGGKFPLWLSPRPVIIVPVSHDNDGYAVETVQKAILSAGIYCDVDVSDLTFNKKIRNAETSHYNVIAVVGAKEQSSNIVNVRKASANGRDVELSVTDFVTALKLKIETYSRDNIFISGSNN